MQVNIMLHTASRLDHGNARVKFVDSRVQLLSYLVQHLDHRIELLDYARPNPSDDCSKHSEQRGDKHSRDG